MPVASARLIKTTGLREPSFPNATYYIQEKELAFAFEKGFPSYITKNWSV